MKKKLFAILIILMTISLCGCDDTWEDEPAETEIAEDEIKETAGDGKENDKTIDAEPVSVDSDARSATIMVYMNGSDLETQAGEATTDIAEMIDSGIGENVNVIIQTMGTKRWHDYDISSQTSQIYRVNKGELELIEDDLGQLDCTALIQILCLIFWAMPGRIIRPTGICSSSGTTAPARSMASATMNGRMLRHP